MSEQYPRVNSCLYSWCKERRPECDRCDRVQAILRRKQFMLVLTQYRWSWLANLVYAIKRARGKLVWRWRH